MSRGLYAACGKRLGQFSSGCRGVPSCRYGL